MLKNFSGRILSAVPVVSMCGHAQVADQQLLAEINKIKAIDNHSILPGLSRRVKRTMILMPALRPFRASDPTTVTRPENPQYIAAWKAL